MMRTPITLILMVIITSIIVGSLNIVEGSTGIDVRKELLKQLVYEEVEKSVYVVRYRPYYVYHGKYVDVRIYLENVMGIIKYMFLSELAKKVPESKGCASYKGYLKNLRKCYYEISRFKEVIDNRIPSKFRDLVRNITASSYRKLRLIHMSPYMIPTIYVYEDEYRVYRDKLVLLAKELINSLQDFNVTYSVIVVVPSILKVYDKIDYIYGSAYGLHSKSMETICRILHNEIMTKYFEILKEKYDMIYRGCGDGLKGIGPVIGWGNFSERGIPSKESLIYIAKLIDDAIGLHLDDEEFQEFLTIFRREVKNLGLDIPRLIISVEISQTRYVKLPILIPTTITPSTNTITSLPTEELSVYRWLIPVLIISLSSIIIGITLKRYLK